MIVDMAIHAFVCQKSDFHRNSDFQNFQKLDPLQITAKKFQAKIWGWDKNRGISEHRFTI
jgi:hypothetical protein